MRFDWYQTSIHRQPPEVIERLLTLGHELRPADGLARRYHYQQGFQVHHHQKGVVATVLAGGNGPWPHAWASSDATDSFVDLVRDAWPSDHLVTRMDPAEDYNDRRAFKQLRKLSRRVALEHGLKFTAIADELDSQAGRTQYIGSEKSSYRARLYEKGFEVLAQSPAIFKLYRTNPQGFRIIRNEATGEEVRPEDWIRLELQCRPDGEEARRQAAQASPLDAWGFTAWSTALARLAFANDLKRVYMRTRKRSKDDEALRWMCSQYGPLLQRVYADLGGWKEVGLTIGELVNELKGGK